MHLPNRELHEDGFSSARIPLDPEKPSGFLIPGLVYGIFQKPLTSPFRGFDLFISLLLLWKGE